jgi:acyl-CoA oxidase
MLFGDKLEKREKFRKFFAEHPLFNYDQREFKSLYDIRDIAYKRIKAVSDAKFFSIYDFVNDPMNLFTCHENLAWIDGSMATKFTVQNNLFGGSLMALSTE